MPPFSPKTWKNDPDHTTPIDAAGLIDLEQRVYAGALADAAAYTDTASGLLVPKSLVDAKGDSLWGTADNTLGRLAVSGTDGKVLTEDSSAATGSAWKNNTAPGEAWLPTAAKVETLIPRYLTSTGAVVLVSGTLYLVGLAKPLLAGVTYTSISWPSNGAATAPTNWWFTLVNGADMKTLRSTADQTNTAWGGSTTKTVNLSSTYTPAADILKPYLGIMMVATTPISVRMSAAGNTLHFGIAPIVVGTSNTGMTTPPADGTTMNALTALTQMPWGYVS